MNKVLCFFILITAAFSVAAQESSLRTIQMPRIQNSTLKITGPIDSHIYDALAYMTSELTSVTTVELNSYGGSTLWALEIARKIKELNLNTFIPSGNVCASACVYIFSAGRERLASPDTWLGIHGARLGPGFRLEFQTHCFVYSENNSPSFRSDKVGCEAIIDKWFEIAMKSTLDSFAFMEASGVSENLRLDYLSMDVDPNWPQQGNIIQIQDWRLSALDALSYNLVTQIRP